MWKEERDWEAKELRNGEVDKQVELILPVCAFIQIHLHWNEM